jgi:hypothetical protein
MIIGFGSGRRIAADSTMVDLHDAAARGGIGVVLEFGSD